MSVGPYSSPYRNETDRNCCCEPVGCCAYPGIAVMRIEPSENRCEEYKQQHRQRNGADLWESWTSPDECKKPNKRSGQNQRVIKIQTWPALEVGEKNKCSPKDPQRK